MIGSILQAISLTYLWISDSRLCDVLVYTEMMMFFEVSLYKITIIYREKRIAHITHASRLWSIFVPTSLRPSYARSQGSIWFDLITIVSVNQGSFIDRPKWGLMFLCLHDCSSDHAFHVQTSADPVCLAPECNSDRLTRDLCVKDGVSTAANQSLTKASVHTYIHQLTDCLQHPLKCTTIWFH